MDPESVTLRQSQAIWIPIVVWVVCALAVGDAIVEGTPGYTIRVVALVAAIAYIVYICLARPSLMVDGEGITISNVVHTNRIPFGALTDIRVGGLTSVVARTADGRERKVTSWNAPGVSRRPPRAGEQPSSESEVEHFLRNRWDAWKLKNPQDSVHPALVRGWNWRELIIATALITLNIAIRLR